MKDFDSERERSEKTHSLSEFVAVYNEGLPDVFPRASLATLRIFQETYPNLFKNGKDVWSLDCHRKKLIDWLPQHIKSLAPTNAA